MEINLCKGGAEPKARKDKHGEAVERLVNPHECREIIAPGIAAPKLSATMRRTMSGPAPCNTSPERKRAQSERSLAWAKANPERVKEINAAHHKRHAEKRRAAYKKWAAENPEKRAALDLASRARRRKVLSERSVKWARENPEKSRVIRQAKRARKASATGSHSAADLARIRRQQKDRCAYCRAALRGGGHIDHIIALARGGSNGASNLQWLCPSCNSSKGAKDPITYAQSLGRLI